MTTQSSPPPGSDPGFSGITEVAGHSGRAATVVSCLAFAFSGFSLYESALKQADLEVHVPPVVHYGREAGGDIELFAVPLTIANEGARTGTVLSMTLTVEDQKSKRTRRFYSAYIGEHATSDASPAKAFAPLSIPGRGVYTETVRFLPEGNPLPRLVEEAGELKLTLTLNVAGPASPGILDRLTRSTPAPTQFTRVIPYVTEQGLNFRRQSIPMHAPGWTATAPARKP